METEFGVTMRDKIQYKCFSKAYFHNITFTPSSPSPHLQEVGECCSFQGGSGAPG